MKRLLLTLLFITPLFVSAQYTVQLQSSKPVSDTWKALLAEDQYLRDNDLLNEEVLDLVQCYVTDSMLTKSAERHRVPPGMLIRWVGLRWKAIWMKKTKWVGTSQTEIRIPGKPLFTEYDINFNLCPHIPKYQDMLWRGIEKQLDYGRVKEKERLLPPYVPMIPGNEEKYHLHVECTPLADSLPAINEKFYPCIRPGSLAEHPNFGEKRVSIGMYGTFCSDCNHSCHPELHPYEWIWWLDLNPKMEKAPNSRTWVLGMMRDVSNRMKHWSSSPRTGVISIPFAFPTSSTQWTIELKSLVANEFDPDAFAELNIPENAVTLDQPQMDFKVEGEGIGNRLINLLTAGKFSSEAHQGWLSGLNHDQAAGLVTGYFNIAISVADVYTTKVEFRY